MVVFNRCGVAQSPQFIGGNVFVRRIVVRFAAQHGIQSLNGRDDDFRVLVNRVVLHMLNDVSVRKKAVFVVQIKI